MFRERHYFFIYCCSATSGVVFIGQIKSTSGHAGCPLWHGGTVEHIPGHYGVTFTTFQLWKMDGIGLWASLASMSHTSLPNSPEYCTSWSCHSNIFNTKHVQAGLPNSEQKHKFGFWLPSRHSPSQPAPPLIPASLPPQCAVESMHAMCLADMAVSCQLLQCNIMWLPVLMDPDSSGVFFQPRSIIIYKCLSTFHYDR